MDDIQKIMYGALFDRDFHRKNFNEFQDWFAKIASLSYGNEFVTVKPYGRSGDLKCDGYHAGTKTVYQCYAPYNVEEKQLIFKIKTDLAGAARRVHTTIKLVIIYLSSQPILRIIAYYRNNHNKKIFELVRILEIQNEENREVLLIL